MENHDRFPTGETRPTNNVPHVQLEPLLPHDFQAEYDQTMAHLSAFTIHHYPSSAATQPRERDSDDDDTTESPIPRKS